VRSFIVGAVIGYILAYYVIGPYVIGPILNRRTRR
jgi:hypothetical protein